MTMIAANADVRRPRTEQRHRAERHEHQRAGAVGDVVKAGEDRRRTARRPVPGRFPVSARLQHLEGRGATMAPSIDHAAEPHDQREHVDSTGARASGHYNERQTRFPEVPCAPSFLARAALKNIATRLRIDSVRATSEAGSGHPNLRSAAEIVAALFFAEMRYDPRDPAATRTTIASCSRKDMPRRSSMRHGPKPGFSSARPAHAAADRLGSRRSPDAAPAICRRGHRLARPGPLRGRRHRAQRAAHQVRLPHLRAARRRRDRRRLGLGSGRGRRLQTARLALRASPTSTVSVRVGPRSWTTTWRRTPRGGAPSAGTRSSIDGHDLPAILDALEEARRTKGRPTMILARTLKGKGISFTEGKNGWHGKAFKKGEELDKALRSSSRSSCPRTSRPRCPTAAAQRAATARPEAARSARAAAYKLGDSVATREAYGTALAKLGDGDDRIVALDGDVKNSTFSEKFEEKHPDRFYQNFIAEQVMIGSAMGLAARGAIPFPSTFAAFLTRAVRLHPDGGHQQRERQDGRVARRRVDRRGRAVADGARRPGDDARAAEHHRPLSVRRDEHRAAARADGVPSRPRLHADLAAEDAGHLRSRRDVRDRRIEGPASERERRRDGHRRGLTVFEALKAYDELQKSGDQHPRRSTLLAAADRLRDRCCSCARDTGGRLITVEDHYAAGGIGDAVADRRAPTRASRSSGSASAKFRAAARRRSWSITTASRHAISLQRWPHEKSQRLPENRRHRRRNGYRGRGGVESTVDAQTPAAKPAPASAPVSHAYTFLTAPEAAFIEAAVIGSSLPTT